MNKSALKEIERTMPMLESLYAKQVKNKREIEAIVSNLSFAMSCGYSNDMWKFLASAKKCVDLADELMVSVGTLKFDLEYRKRGLFK